MLRASVLYLCFILAVAAYSKDTHAPNCTCELVGSAGSPYSPQHDRQMIPAKGSLAMAVSLAELEAYYGEPKQARTDVHTIQASSIA